MQHGVLHEASCISPLTYIGSRALFRGRSAFGKDRWYGGNPPSPLRGGEINLRERGEEVGAVRGDVAAAYPLGASLRQPVELADDLDDGCGAAPHRCEHARLGAILATKTDPVDLARGRARLRDQVAERTRGQAAGVHSDRAQRRCDAPAECI